jgi:hypothetical protein
MRWLHYPIVAAAGIVAGVASCIGLAFAASLAIQLIAALSGDPSMGDSFGWLLVFTWPIWLGLLLGAGGLIGVISAMFVHKKLLDGDTAPEQR